MRTESLGFSMEDWVTLRPSEYQVIECRFICWGNIMQHLYIFVLTGCPRSKTTLARCTWSWFHFGRPWAVETTLESFNWNERGLQSAKEHRNLKSKVDWCCGFRKQVRNPTPIINYVSLANQSGKCQRHFFSLVANIRAPPKFRQDKRFIMCFQFLYCLSLSHLQSLRFQIQDWMNYGETLQVMEPRCRKVCKRDPGNSARSVLVYALRSWGVSAYILTFRDISSKGFMTSSDSR